jgi:ketosteroid isomerase-like protein
VRAGALLLALISTSCAFAQQDDGAAREAERTMLSLMAAWERADAPLLEELFWPQATYDDFPNQHTYRGIDEILGYVRALHSWADDVYMNVGRVHVTESGAVAEWVFSAVQARPIAGRVEIATGREVVANGVTIIELEGGRIMRAADYTDAAPMLLQLGGRFELPDGSTLERDPGR